MNLKKPLLAALSLSAFTLCVQSSALASTVGVTYYTITSNNPDTGGTITGQVTGLVQSTLGPDVLPVQSAPNTFNDVNGVGELQWWTPHSSGATPLVTAGTSFVYSNPVTLPFNIPANFFPNGPSGSNGGAVGYTSAVLSASFVTPVGGHVTFTLGSDDDAWIFLNGQLVVDDGGVHAFAPAPTTITGLAPGTNTVEVFFADRHVTQSGLYFDADVTLNSLTTGVPEPSSWAMMILGFAGVGFMAYRQKKRSALMAA
jgi:fibro-slime domain-containing protein